MRIIQSSIVKRSIYVFNHDYICWECPLVKVWSLGLVSKHWYTVCSQFCYMFACCHFYYRLHLLLVTIHTTCISLSLRRTSAPIHLTSVLSVLGTQETSCILTAGLLERNIFDLYLPEFDIPWVVHLRETCCCLQTSALGGPTLSTRVEAFVDIKHFSGAVAGEVSRSEERRVGKECRL